MAFVKSATLVSNFSFSPVGPTACVAEIVTSVSLLESDLSAFAVIRTDQVRVLDASGWVRS